MGAEKAATTRRTLRGATPCDTKPLCDPKAPFATPRGRRCHQGARMPSPHCLPRAEQLHPTPCVQLEEHGARRVSSPLCSPRKEHPQPILQPIPQPGGQREDATAETLRMVGCAVRDVHAVIQASHFAESRRRHAEEATDGARAGGGGVCEGTDAIAAAVAEVVAKSTLVAGEDGRTAKATTKAVGIAVEGTRHPPAGKAAPGTRLSARSPAAGSTTPLSPRRACLASARETHKARINAAARSTRFTHGLLEKIKGMQEDLGVPSGSCSSTHVGSSSSDSRATSLSSLAPLS